MDHLLESIIVLLVVFDKLVGIFVELVRGGLTAVLALATHDGHAVLREGAGLVGADAAGGPEGLH